MPWISLRMKIPWTKPYTSWKCWNLGAWSQKCWSSIMYCFPGSLLFTAVINSEDELNPSLFSCLMRFRFNISARSRLAFIPGISWISPSLLQSTAPRCKITFLQSELSVWASWLGKKIHFHVPSEPFVGNLPIWPWFCAVSWVWAGTVFSSTDWGYK